MERTSEEISLHDRLMTETLQKRKVKLSGLQEIKFDALCWKAIDENNNLTFREYLIATNRYLTLVLDFPELSF